MSSEAFDPASVPTVAWPEASSITLGARAYDANNATREATMPKYLLQVNYTLDGVKGVLSKGGSARKAAAQAAAESVGGTLESDVLRLRKHRRLRHR